MSKALTIRAGIITLAVLAQAGCSAPTVPEEAGRASAAGAGEEVLMIEEHRSGDWSPGLTDEEKATLFAIATDTLDWCVRSPSTPFTFDGYALTAKLKTEMATFVTLKLDGSLRGCIGTLEPRAPLYRSVHENAVNAAVKDFRFRPVSPRELPKIELHISILSPIVEIASIDEFKIGEHGIILEKGMNRAVYLPEVAVEQGWSKEQTLSSLSQKAGLPPNAWREGARFKVFSSVGISRRGP